MIHVNRVWNINLLPLSLSRTTSRCLKSPDGGRWPPPSLLVVKMKDKLLFYSPFDFQLCELQEGPQEYITPPHTHSYSCSHPYFCAISSFIYDAVINIASSVRLPAFTASISWLSRLNKTQMAHSSSARRNYHKPECSLNELLGEKNTPPHRHHPAGAT